MQSQSSQTEKIIPQLIQLLAKGNAHATLDDALKNIPFEFISQKLEGLPYNIWQLAQHIRIAQWDILEFSRNPGYKSPQWPQGYWPSVEKPATEDDWNNCIEQIKNDRKEFIELIKILQEKLFDPIPNGDGQTLFREALVLADHNSYHTGEIIVLRRLLKIWGK